VYDYRDAPIPLIVMSLLKGGTLGKFMSEEAPLRPRRVIAVLREVASALDHIHSSGFIHRNVTPQNIFLTEDGVAKLIDFGIAGMPTAGETAGLRVDHRGDIWSLAVVGFEMLAGRHPFPGDSLMERFARVIQEPVPSLFQSKPELPPACDVIFARALARNPDDRYPSAGEFADALTAVFPPAPGLLSKLLGKARTTR